MGKEGERFVVDTISDVRLNAVETFLSKNDIKGIPAS